MNPHCSPPAVSRGFATHFTQFSLLLCIYRENIASKPLITRHQGEKGLLLAHAAFDLAD
jgi:hypothetical protein